MSYFTPEERAQINDLDLVTRKELEFRATEVQYTKYGLWLDLAQMAALVLGATVGYDFLSKKLRQLVR